MSDFKFNKYYKSRHESAVACRGKIDNCPVSCRTDARLVSKISYDENTRRMVRTSSFSVVDRNEEMKNYKVSDFSLENLQAIGAKLTDVGSIAGSRFASILNAEKHLSNMENSINNSNNN